MAFRCAALAATLCACAVAAGSARAQPLVPAMFAPYLGTPPSAADVARIHRAGVQVLRVVVSWSQVAPAKRPPGFDPANPDEEGYDWRAADEAVTTAVHDGFQPIVDVTGAPAWGAGAPATTDSTGRPQGPLDPEPRELAQFATAAATRYSGDYQGLPRVRYWQVYNEPNLEEDLRPQFEGGSAVSPDLYRNLVNAFADSVHAVHPDNLVVAGGLTPFTFHAEGRQLSVAPLEFMRQFLCMSAGVHPHPTCAATAHFDVWGHNPYTSGGPTHKAANPDDVSLGDLAAMHRLLRAAAKAGKIVSRAPPRFWVTEFSWDSSPPDSAAAPVALLDRWVPQAMYQMWRNGVSLVTWFTLRDQPRPSYMQPGLYYEDGRAKPYLRGFRFPLVAFPRAHGFYVWGRTPTGTRGTVVVQQWTSGRWRRVGTVRSDRYGIFQRTFRAARTGWVRALLPGDHSLPFSLKAVPDKSFDAFGS